MTGTALGMTPQGVATQEREASRWEVKGKPDMDRTSLHSSSEMSGESTSADMDRDSEFFESPSVSPTESPTNSRKSTGTSGVKNLMKRLFGSSKSSNNDDQKTAKSAQTTKSAEAATSDSPSTSARSQASGKAPAFSPSTDRVSLPSSSPSKIPFKVGRIYKLLPGRLSFAVFSSDEMTESYISKFSQIFFFSGEYQERYEPFCYDFGPVNLAVVHSFNEFVREYWNHPNLKKRELVYYSEEAKDIRTNCAFLLGAFMVCELGMTPEQAWEPFSRITDDAFATFRDATWCEQDYHLTILACLEGLYRSVRSKFYIAKSFSVGDYLYMDHPNNADMHMVSPKFVAFKGPHNSRNQIGNSGVYTFTPRHYIQVFKHLNVTAVVRLNEKIYNETEFTKNGINHYDLYFDDCTVPSEEIVHKFLAIAEKEQGVVAVHCKAGLGRTGTLIAIYFMKHFGWTANECIGWLRIVRPGSIIGPQQQYLHWAEERFCSKKSSRSRQPRPRAPFHPTISASEAAAMGQAIADAQNQRASACIGRTSSIDPGSGRGSRPGSVSGKSRGDGSGFLSRLSSTGAESMSGSHQRSTSIHSCPPVFPTFFTVAEGSSPSAESRSSTGDSIPA